MATAFEQLLLTNSYALVRLSSEEKAVVNALGPATKDRADYGVMIDGQSAADIDLGDLKIGDVIRAQLREPTTNALTDVIIDVIANQYAGRQTRVRYSRQDSPKGERDLGQTYTRARRLGDIRELQGREPVLTIYSPAKHSANDQLLTRHSKSTPAEVGANVFVEMAAVERDHIATQRLTRPPTLSATVHELAGELMDAARLPKSNTLPHGVQLAELIRNGDEKLADMLRRSQRTSSEELLRRLADETAGNPDGEFLHTQASAALEKLGWNRPVHKPALPAEPAAHARPPSPDDTMEIWAAGTRPRGRIYRSTSASPTSRDDETTKSIVPAGRTEPPDPGWPESPKADPLTLTDDDLRLLLAPPPESPSRTAAADEGRFTIGEPWREKVGDDTRHRAVVGCRLQNTETWRDALNDPNTSAVILKLEKLGSAGVNLVIRKSLSGLEGYEMKNGGLRRLSSTTVNQLVGSPYTAEGSETPYGKTTDAIQVHPDSLQIFDRTESIPPQLSSTEGLAPALIRASVGDVDLGAFLDF
jgi:hypothetical protein